LLAARRVHSRREPSVRPVLLEPIADHFAS
jgi:hypothetical protein